MVPTTVRQAFAILDSLFSEKEKNVFRGMSASEFEDNQHFSLGAWIRNNWIYGEDEEESPEEREMRDRCYRMLAGMKEGDLLFEHPDNVSSRFLRRYHRHLLRKGKGV